MAGSIGLRHKVSLRNVANRFEQATRQIEANQAAGKIPKRKPIAVDYTMRRALTLPPEAQYDRIMRRPASADLGVTFNAAIEVSFEPLAGVLPRDYGKFERPVLEGLLRVYNRDALKTASGDRSGRNYGYVLMKFAMQGAQDNGEFFTPPSIVQAIVDVIEPDHETVFNHVWQQSSHRDGSAGLNA